jgi:DNA-directed RNA polymerase specialized sigma24 family protein
MVERFQECAREIEEKNRDARRRREKLPEHDPLAANSSGKTAFPGFACGALFAAIGRWAELDARPKENDIVDERVSGWIRQLAQGDESAAAALWNRYFEQLVRLAYTKLRGARRRVADEEDVALSAFHSFCQGVAAGRFPDLKDRDDLWKLLVTITARKAVALMRRAHAQKRQAEIGESALLSPADSADQSGIEGVMSPEPTPDFAVQVGEECERLLALLADQGLRDVALKKLEGCNNLEIADSLGCSPGTVQRRLTRIQEKWSRELRS